MTSQRRALTAAVLIASSCGWLAVSACGPRRVRVYDPYYRDYHSWTAVEVPYYDRWIVETHHPRVEYRALRRDEQEAYWRWRHDHH